jgi:ribosomal protein L13E
MKAIEADPDGDTAQAAIAELLRATPGFEPLKQNLYDEEQREPGIITRQGRLVNANTRAVALRELNQEYIEVAVLPTDATIGEIYDLELDLQVAQDYRQDYSFTNELLFIDDLITEQNRDEEEVGLRLRWATSTKQSSIKKAVEKVRRYVRHLELIREIQQMSGGKVPLTDFDDAEQTLQEFDNAYEALRDKDPAGATRLKQARTLGLLVDLGYERQRAVNAEWVETYLAEAFEEQEVLKDLIKPIAADGLSGDGFDHNGGLGDLDDFEDIDDEAAPAIHRVVGELTRRLGESAREDVVKLPTSAGEQEFDRETIRSAINDAMRTAAEDAKSAAKAGNALNLPIQLVEEAAKKLARAREAYDKVSTGADFDAKAMQAEVERATRALDALKLTIGS